MGIEVKGDVIKSTSSETMRIVVSLGMGTEEEEASFLEGLQITFTETVWGKYYSEYTHTIFQIFDAFNSLNHIQNLIPFLRQTVP